MKNVKLRKGRSIVTIQGVLQEKIKKITGEDTKVIGAAKTDAGVHAIEQVAAFKTKSNLDPQTFLRALNANLPYDIRVIDAAECPADFHPRYSAKSKTYSYIISPANTFSPSPLPPPPFYSYSVFLRRYSWQISYKLNCDLMREAAQYLIGRYDFSSFRGSGCGSKNPVRTIFKIEISEFPSVNFMSFKFNTHVIKISIEVDAFLRHMARNIVGTLVEVSRGRFSPSSIKEILESKDRRLSGSTAPACGLFLEEISY